MKQWVQGYACALATIVKSHGSNTEIEEALVACGLTSVKELRKHGVEESDIDTLRVTIKHLTTRTKRKRDS